MLALCCTRSGVRRSVGDPRFWVVIAMIFTPVFCGSTSWTSQRRAPVKGSARAHFDLVRLRLFRFRDLDGQNSVLHGGLALLRIDLEGQGEGSRKLIRSTLLAMGRVALRGITLALAGEADGGLVYRQAKVLLRQDRK